MKRIGEETVSKKGNKLERKERRDGVYDGENKKTSSKEVSE